MIHLATLRLSVARRQNERSLLLASLSGTHTAYTLSPVKTTKGKPKLIKDDVAPLSTAKIAVLSKEIADENNVKKKPELNNQHQWHLIDSHMSITSHEADAAIQMQPFVVPSVSTESHTSGQNPFNSGKNQVMVTIRPPPQSMLPPRNDSRITYSPMFYEVEARIVPDIPIYNAVQVQDNNQPLPC